MKFHLRHLVIVALIAIAFSRVSVAQQYAYRIATNVPYDFYVGEQLCSAGDYIFAVNYGDRAVTITNQANGHSSVVLASPIEFASPGYDNRNKGAVVELIPVGDGYVLSNVQTRTDGVTFSKRAFTRTMAKSDGVITLVASLR